MLVLIEAEVKIFAQQASFEGNSAGPVPFPEKPTVPDDPKLKGLGSAVEHTHIQPFRPASEGGAQDSLSLLAEDLTHLPTGRLGQQDRDVDVAPRGGTPGLRAMEVKGHDPALLAPLNDSLVHRKIHSTIIPCPL